MKNIESFLFKCIVASLSVLITSFVISCNQYNVEEETVIKDNLTLNKATRVGGTSGTRVGYLWFNPLYIGAVVDEIETINGFSSSPIKEYYKNLTHVNLSFLNPTDDKGTSIAISEDGNTIIYTKGKSKFNLDQSKLKSLVTQLKTAKSNLRVGLAVGGGAASGSLSNRYKSIFGNSTYRLNFISSLVNYAKNTGCDYLDIDIEYTGLALTGYNEFVQKCYTVGKQNGINLTLTLEYKYADNGIVTKVNNVSQATYNSCDLLNIMSYDYDDNSSTTKIKDPNHSPVAIAKRDVDYFATKVPSDKIVLGIPLYGKKAFSKNPNDGYYSIHLSDVDAVTGLHKKTNLYFNSKEMISQKLKYASDKGISGIMFWSIRSDKMSDYNNLVLKYVVDNQR